ncbi:MAG: TauD/TfdA family dioxygenase [Rubrivivax sp.]|nr:TauD/TfdA family dioxygenase [Rubrivivax sp.]
MSAPAVLDSRSPFDLDDDASYRAWRDWKLRHRAREASDLLVDVEDPRRLTAGEQQRLRERIARHGTALYRSRQAGEDPQLPLALGAQLGLVRLDANWLADEDGLSRIAVAAPERGTTAGPAGEPGAAGKPGDTVRGEFIPYTDRAIGWHTDGYYHPQARRILGMILHCVRPAAAGGETSVLDHTLAYIALRERSPELVRALMHPQAMTIPAREDEAGEARAAQAGPVFSVVDGHHLHMRYTARTRSIGWRDDARTREAAQAITQLLSGTPAEVPGLLRFTLAPGMGLVGDNVLHARSAFADDARAPRLLYRARYLDRVPVDAMEAACRTG